MAIINKLTLCSIQKCTILRFVFFSSFSLPLIFANVSVWLCGFSFNVTWHWAGAMLMAERETKKITPIEMLLVVILFGDEINAFINNLIPSLSQPIRYFTQFICTNIKHTVYIEIYRVTIIYMCLSGVSVS